ncbi:hypothetical protein Desdi_2356 [Desulfitobacterium dichloroeliminans LMG P-21439]|uniref:DZANK-type domain-containing protein n=1 Tax=Desulfitobacterium dichloroeliminans (strain LMG P-21439 / DCA1) TaxID=871963 RepID=L0F9S8_DESDL|nr:zinc ribbon domain-containing protein [Desulfitobacterium dichloroeliminans]AGA69780.1 hypothetical protein Desdi_2356 [Desulfitobacterium dichloroeliminans LMG P-21439]
MFCRECGSEIRKNVKFCPKCEVTPLSGTKHCQACGATTKSKQNLCKKCGAQLIKKEAVSKEDAPKAAKLASLFMPVVGLVLFFVWHKKKPQLADSVCNWSILGLIGGMILYAIGLASGVFGSLFGF